MGLKLDLETLPAKVFREQWTESEGRVIPTDVSVTLGNDGINLDATVLYADLAEPTLLVDTQSKTFAAEVYKVYLACAARLVRDNGGVITAYDGDRIMAVFLGDSKNTSAVRTALEINYAVQNIIMPAKVRQYPSNSYELKQVIGIDTSPLMVSKTGVRGANDLVWVGRAANHAAKLTALPDTYSTYITRAVYESMNAEVRISNGKTMWEQVKWNTFNNSIIYRSNYWWSIS